MATDIDMFSRRLRGEENAVQGDEAKLGRDEERLQTFSERLGLPLQAPPPDERLADNSPKWTLGGGDRIAPPQPIPQEADLVAQKEKDQAIYQAYKAERDAPAQPAQLRSLLGPGNAAPPSPIPAGMQIGPNGGLMPAPPAQPALAPMTAPAGAPAGVPELTMPTYRAPTTIAAHWDKSRDPLHASTRDMQRSDVRAVLGADIAENRAVQQQNTIQADALESAANDAEARRVERMAAEQGRQKYLADQQSKLDTVIQDVATAKVDPKRLYGNADTGTRLMLIIGGMFGGLADRGNGNEFLKHIQANIDRDVDAQKANIENKKFGAQQGRGMLNDLRQDFGDARMGELANEKAAWTNVNTMIDAQMARAQNPLMQARGEKMRAMAQGRLTDIQAQIDQVTHVNSYTAGGNAGNPQAPDPLFVPTGANGVGFRARTPKEAEQARGVVYAKQNILPLLDRMKAIYRKTNFVERGVKSVYTSADVTSLQSLQAQVALNLRELSTTSPGAMDKGMQELAGQIQGDWTSMQGNPERAATEFARTIGNQLDSLERAQGGQGAHQEVRRDTTGNFYTTSQGEPSYASQRPGMPQMRKTDGTVVPGDPVSTAQETPGYYEQDAASSPGAPKPGKAAGHGKKHGHK